MIRSAQDQSGLTENGKSVEDVYQKKTQLEHILLRPDTYIGSTEPNETTLWVIEDDKLVYKNVVIVPGLYKIFDEILVNAADNKIRDESMNTVKVDIDEVEGIISVYNNGAGIPVMLHRKEKVYVPELIFGHLLTSSNYDDDVKKVTGGRNGYGAKLCNIFSVMFSVETSNKESGYKFKQTFYENMTRKDEASITKAASSDYTKITFKPDLKKFGMNKFDSDFISLLKKRVYDLAGILEGLKVYINGEQIKIKNFREYMRLYVTSTQKEDDSDKVPMIYEKCNDRWEIGFILSEGQFQQVSFVNSVCTSKGGTHVNLISDQIASRIADVIKKKAKDVTIKSHQIKSYMWVFVKCLIENPTFDSQTKENMTLKPIKFGSKCNISDDFIKKILKSGIVDSVVGFAKLRQEQQLKRSDGTRRVRISGIPKLDDANCAGLRSRGLCTIILTEGDSAKALAVSGLSEVGRDEYGVFPLKGKPLNVRDASNKQILDNTEISNIKQIIGLKQGENYESTESLRYDRVMIMTDQDHDGSHIKGLLINLFDNFWPSLLKRPNFLVQFITPIIRVKKGNNQIDFYSLPEFEKWQIENGGTKGWNVKYLKGLGTSTSDDAKKYFGNIKKHVKLFSESTETDRRELELAFSKKRANERKKWLGAHTPDVYMDYNCEEISISEFVNKELILYSMADNIRSIPSIADGLKPGQRKILFCSLKRNLTRNEIKVVQLSGYVSERSAYHHGEVSLQATIVGLAQDFVGSNNLNLLEPRGQFGTRLQGGKDHAHARYIFTRLSKLCRLTFRPEDDAILNYLNEENLSIEPEWYVPIIPLVLCNGAEGIGTGWSTSIMNYNPMDIINNIRRKIDGMPFKPMTPWYSGFNGILEEDGDKYKITGTIKKIDDTTLNITELPLHCWTLTYKEFLEGLVTGNDKTPPFIKDFKEYHTDTSVDFLITLTPDNMRAALVEGLEKKFKLITTKTTSNMVLFDTTGTLKRYDSVLDIMDEFYHLRFSYYEKRKSYLVSEVEKLLSKLSNQARFIEEVINGMINVHNVKKDKIIASLKERNYAPVKKEPPKVTNDEEVTQGDSNAEDGLDEDASGYEYLMNMPIWSLTRERFEKLLENRNCKQAELDILSATSPADMWKKDLDELADAWQKHAAEKKKIMSENIISSKKRRFANFKPGSKRSASHHSTATSSYKFKSHGRSVSKPPVQKEKKMKDIHSFIDGMSRNNSKGQTKLDQHVSSKGQSNSDTVIINDSDSNSDEIILPTRSTTRPRNSTTIMDMCDTNDTDDMDMSISGPDETSDWVPGRD